MAKGIGNGYPLAAVVTTQEIARSLNKASHFNTFGGNPVACAVGEAVLEVFFNRFYVIYFVVHVFFFLNR